MKKLKFKKETERIVAALAIVDLAIVLLPGSVEGAAIAGVCYYINLILLLRFGHLKEIVKMLVNE